MNFKQSNYCQDTRGGNVIYFVTSDRLCLEMIYNIASRIITSIILFDLKTVCKSITGASSFAISPIRDPDRQELKTRHIITLTTSIKKMRIGFLLENFGSEEEKRFMSYLDDMTSDMMKILRILLKKNVNAWYQHFPGPEKLEDNCREITISFTIDQTEKYILLIIPVAFFRLINRKITEDEDSEEIEHAVVRYFVSSKWNLPDVPYLISSLNDTELNKLINHLQRSNLLTPYQLLLLINAYPEYSLRIKKSLSKNTVDDIIMLKKHYEKNSRAKNLGLTRRDFAEGIYSIQESIYFMMQAYTDFNYSRFLVYLQTIILSAMHNELLFRMTFSDWISEIEENSLMYETLSITDESVIAKSVSANADQLIAAFGKYISKRKLSSIKSLSGKRYSFMEVRNAQIIFLLNYRKVVIQRINPTKESLDYLVSRFTDEKDYTKLLLTVGWFVLSTALKDVRKKTAQHIIQNLPYAPRCLIEDVLKGTVNPNILHDEIQVKKSKKACVKGIMTLYEDGIIDLES